MQYRPHSPHCAEYAFTRLGDSSQTPGNKTVRLNGAKTPKNAVRAVVRTVHVSNYVNIDTLSPTSNRLPSPCFVLE